MPNSPPSLIPTLLLLCEVSVLLVLSLVNSRAMNSPCSRTWLQR